MEHLWKYAEKEKLNKKQLLQELALDIARRYGIDEQKTQELIQENTLLSLENLKVELKKQELFKDIKQKELEKLFFTLKWALDIVEDISKLKIKVLKQDIETALNIDTFTNNIEDYLPKDLLIKAKNPSKVHEHILWIALGSANSIMKTAEALYLIGKWILKTPYDLYMIISGKGEMDSIKNI